MEDSKRQKIVSAIIARMETIRASNGYQTNLGANVRDWETNWDDSELPALSVCDLTQEEGEESPDEAYTIYKLPVQLRIFAKAEMRAAETRKMIADVFKAIKSDLKWTVEETALALRTEYGRDGFILPEDAFSVAGAAVEINIFYYTKLFDAYE